jgi:NitT/TauT family transport system permease protein
VRRFLLNLIGGIVVIAVATLLIVSFVPYPEAKLLPLYTLSTISRIGLTLIISIVWGVSFGVLAATSKIASRVLVPVIDLLQSLPILGYFPIVIAALFVWGAFGIELAIIILLFTSMAWSIFFGVMGAVRSLSPNIVEAGRSFGMVGWPYIRHIVLPAIVPAVISSGNLAWCDGWFFIIAAEYIQYQGTVVKPPSGGLGYLLAKAAYGYQDMTLAIILLLFITFIVVYFNAITWHRLMEQTSAGSYKPLFKIGLSGLGRLKLGRHVEPLPLDELHRHRARTILLTRLRRYSRVEKAIATALAIIAVFVVLFILFGRLPTAAVIIIGFTTPPAGELVTLPLLVGLTLARLGIAYAISLVVAIILGVLAAEHKRVASVLYPIYDIGQGVPILALFPVIYLGLSQLLGSAGIALESTCILMLVLDMVWYMFLNIVSAVKTIPTEIREVGQVFGFKGWRRIWHIVLPSILPAIATGSVLSWGTGWNTVIFAEYLQTNPPVYLAGLGSLMDRAGYLYGNTVVLLFLLAVIAAIVLAMEAFIWRPLLRKHEKYEMTV